MMRCCRTDFTACRAGLRENNECESICCFDGNERENDGRDRSNVNPVRGNR